VIADRLRDRVAVITGAASGIGAEIAHRFAREGAAVALLDRDPVVAEVAAGVSAETGSRTHAAVADATDADAVAAALDDVASALGPLGILVNNAWAGGGEAAVGITDDQWRDTIAGTLTSAFVCSRAALQRMIPAGRGSIVNLASVTAVRFGGHDAYSAAKAGLLSLTRNLAARHGPDGIRVNAIIVGSVVTPAWADRMAADPAILQDLVKYYPLGRLGNPDDIASAAAFLASDDASWVTGAELPVDGGHLVWNGDLARVAEGRRA
jgi:NAD(P)-dependent dehydrogenase (short-subunit alcohol dehydrogenase family)